MEEERFLLHLFDFYWFDSHVLLLKNPPPIPALPPTDDDPVVATASPPGVRSRHRRSHSDQLTFASSSDSALLPHRPHKLHTILSGKTAPEENEEEELEKSAQEGSASSGIGANRSRSKETTSKSSFGRRRGRRGRSENRSRSLSDLEFEELKGFMDLGFDFAEAEADPRLMSIVPGLQRLGIRRRGSSEEGGSAAAAAAVEADREVPAVVVEEEDVAVVDESGITRPYLSESWEVAEEEERRRRSYAEDRLLRNWRIPAAGEGVDMKELLRSWAHTVASVVR